MNEQARSSPSSLRETSTSHGALHDGAMAEFYFVPSKIFRMIIYYFYNGKENNSKHFKRQRFSLLLRHYFHKLRCLYSNAKLTTLLPMNREQTTRSPHMLIQQIV